MVKQPNSTAPRFVSGDLGRHVRDMSVAGGLGLVAVFLVDFADLYFISLLGQKELAAAVGFAGAIMFFATSASIGLGIAVGALVARAIGAGEQERARVVATHSAAISCVVSGLVAALIYVFIPEFTALVGAKGETAELAAEYLRIVTPAAPMVSMMMAGGAILRAHGAGGASMATTLAAAVVNAALDPLLIFGLGPIPALGLEGAAWATVAARTTGALVSFVILFARFGGLAPLRLSALVGDLRPIFAIAGPAMFTNVATPIGAVYLTSVVASFGDEAVAGFAIVNRITPVAFALAFSLSGAIGPIVGQNYGAGAFDRVRGALFEGLKFLGVYVAAVSLLLFLLREPIISMFGAESEGAALLYWFCGPVSLLFFFNGALFAANAFFNNLGRPLLSTLMNWGRNTLGVIPFAMVGAHMFGAPGALLGQGVGGVFFAVLALWLAHRLVAQREAAHMRPEKTPPPLWRWPNWPHATPRA